MNPCSSEEIDSILGCSDIKNRRLYGDDGKVYAPSYHLDCRGSVRWSIYKYYLITVCFCCFKRILQLGC